MTETASQPILDAYTDVEIDSVSYRLHFNCFIGIETANYIVNDFCSKFGYFIEQEIIYNMYCQKCDNTFDVLNVAKFFKLEDKIEKFKLFIEREKLKYSLNAVDCENCNGFCINNICQDCKSVKCDMCMTTHEGECDKLVFKNTVFSICESTLCPCCKKRVHKIEACDHITCACGYSFCYLCGNNFQPGHNCNFEKKLIERLKYQDYYFDFKLKDNNLNIIEFENIMLEKKNIFKKDFFDNKMYQIKNTDDYTEINNIKNDFQQQLNNIEENRNINIKIAMEENNYDFINDIIYEYDECYENIKLTESQIIDNMIIEINKKKSNQIIDLIKNLNEVVEENWDKKCFNIKNDVINCLIQIEKIKLQKKQIELRLQKIEERDKCEKKYIMTKKIVEDYEMKISLGDLSRIIFYYPYCLKKVYENLLNKPIIITLYNI